MISDPPDTDPDQYTTRDEHGVVTLVPQEYVRRNLDPESDDEDGPAIQSNEDGQCGQEAGGQEGDPMRDGTAEEHEQHRLRAIHCHLFSDRGRVGVCQFRTELHPCNAKKPTHPPQITIFLFACILIFQGWVGGFF